MNRSILLRISEAAATLAISERKLHRLVKSGEIPSIRIGAKGLRFSRESLEKWVRDQQGATQGAILETILTA